MEKVKGGQSRVCRSEGEAVDGLGETLMISTPTREMVVFAAMGKHDSNGVHI